MNIIRLIIAKLFTKFDDLLGIDNYWRVDWYKEYKVKSTKSSQTPEKKNIGGESTLPPRNWDKKGSRSGIESTTDKEKSASDLLKERK